MNEDIRVKTEPFEVVTVPMAIKEEVDDELFDSSRQEIMGPVSGGVDYVSVKCKYEGEEITIEENLISCTHEDAQATPRSSGPQCHDEEKYIAEGKIIPTNANGEPISCLQSSAKFTTSYSLKQHGRTTHVAERPFSCEKCLARFIRKSALFAHFHTHTDYKPFSCGVCSASFRTRNTLKRHSLTHTNEKHFSCHVCSGKFTLKSTLTSHLRTHTGEKPFSCVTCSAKFAHHSALKVHTRIHTGDKPFTCKVCSATFTHRSALKSHASVHTGEKPFSCDVCSAKFTRRYSLVGHVHKHL